MTAPDEKTEVAAGRQAWEAAPANAASGAEVIAEFVKRLPNSPGVYRMMNTAGDVLYVGKARSLKKRVANYAKGPGHTQRIARMVAETAAMEFVRTRTETEALLLEANLIKRLRPRFNVLLRDDKSFPYIVFTDEHPAPGLFKHRGARVGKTILFRPLRIGRRGRAHDQCHAEGVSGAHLLGFGLRKPHAAMPALPDQALLGAMHRRDRARRLCRARRRSQELPFGQEQRHPREILATHAAGFGRSRFRNRGDLSRPPVGAFACAGTSGHQPARRCRSRCLRGRTARRTKLRAGVLLPHRPELGQPRLFPARRQIVRAGRSAGSLPGPVLRRQAAAAAGAGFPCDRRSGPACRRADAEGRPQGRGRGSGARRTQGPDRACPAQCCARPWRGGWPKPRRRRSCSKASPKPSASTPRRVASRSTTTRTSWAPTRSAP